MYLYLDKYGFSLRTINFLAKSGAKELSELCEMSTPDLLKLEGIGRKTVEKIRGLMLKPCPFCKRIEMMCQTEFFTTIETGENVAVYFVECQHCKARGPAVEGVGSPDDDWNADLGDASKVLWQNRL